MSLELLLIALFSKLRTHSVSVLFTLANAQQVVKLPDTNVGNDKDPLSNFSAALQTSACHARLKRQSLSPTTCRPPLPPSSSIFIMNRQQSIVVAVPLSTSTLTSGMVPALAVSLAHTRRATSKVLIREPIERDEKQALVVWQPTMLAPSQGNSAPSVFDGAGVALKPTDDMTRVTPAEPPENKNKSSLSSLDRLFIRAVSSKHDQSKALAVWQPFDIVKSTAPTEDTRPIELRFDFWEKDLGDVLVHSDCSVNIADFIL